MEFFKIKKANNVPWGDYGDILMHGMAAFPDEDWPAKNIPIELERTGPFVPPVSFPTIGPVVVADALKNELERSGLTGLRFVPVIKKRIVDLPWETWDLTAPEAPEIPEGGEPEDYIWTRPHSPAVSEKMGDLWELDAQPGIRRVELPKGQPFMVDPKTWTGSDFFRAENPVWTVMISRRAKDWLEQRVGHWITTSPIPTNEQ